MTAYRTTQAALLPATARLGGYRKAFAARLDRAEEAYAREVSPAWGGRGRSGEWRGLTVVLQAGEIEVELGQVRSPSCNRVTSAR